MATYIFRRSTNVKQNKCKENHTYYASNFKIDGNGIQRGNLKRSQRKEFILPSNGTTVRNCHLSSEQKL